MFWLTLIIGIQFMGFGITLVRLAYDEWQQWRIRKEANSGSSTARLFRWRFIKLRMLDAAQSITVEAGR